MNGESNGRKKCVDVRSFLYPAEGGNTPELSYSTTPTTSTAKIESSKVDKVVKSFLLLAV